MEGGDLYKLAAEMEKTSKKVSPSQGDTLGAMSEVVGAFGGIVGGATLLFSSLNGLLDLIELKKKEAMLERLLKDEQRKQTKQIPP